MWYVPKLDQEYLHRMEEVLEVLNQPWDEHAPVVALDERPVQLVDAVRPATAMALGRPARRDYEYARCGTANVFCVMEPKTGRHQTHATKNRTAAQFARALKRVALSYPAATTIHLVLDNLNTHREKSLTATFGPKPGISCGGASRFTTRPSMVVGSIRRNWKPACGRGSAWGASGLPRLPNCADAPAPGTAGRIAPNSKLIGVSPPRTHVACFTTNESLPMSRSTSAP
jgi:hypothetical protein